MLVTSIGRREEYKENLKAMLESYDVSTNDKHTIEQLEKLLEQQRKKQNAKK
jgi:hypothetical protein